MYEEELRRILAIDYGKKRIGLALSDPLLTFAYPYKTISNDNNFQKELSALLVKKNIEKIILGYPLKENGEYTILTEEVLKFKERLEKKYKIEVILRDERYTSSIAQEMIFQSVNKKSKRRDKGLLDQNSAAVILQDYLDEK